MLEECFSIEVDTEDRGENGEEVQNDDLARKKVAGIRPSGRIPATYHAECLLEHHRSGIHIEVDPGDVPTCLRSEKKSSPGNVLWFNQVPHGIRFSDLLEALLTPQFF